MITINPQKTLAELVLERPERARIFEELQLDYCCGGDRSLEAAATENKLDIPALIAIIQAGESEAAEAGSPERDWREASSTELCDHIVGVHHAYLRAELPRLRELSAKVANRHGDTLPELVGLDLLVNTLGDELIEHIDLEERKLFPICRELDAPVEERRSALDVDPSLLAMHEAAHDNVGRALAEMRKLAGDYDQEPALCSSHRRLLISLEALERDLHQHIHEENNILFPRLRPPSD